MILKTITPNIFLIIFDNQVELASTFLRFQEHYESPEFKGKVFTLDEFKKWYTKTSPKGKETGEFTYYTDWHGFNIPSYILKPFYQGKFDPLTNNEQRLLSLFRGRESRFYIIATCKHSKRVNSLVRHEIAHGLFYTNEEYKKQVLNILNKYDITEIKNVIKSKSGYHDDVLDDESHAYILEDRHHFKFEIPEELIKELEELFSKFTKLLNLGQFIISPE